MKRTRSTAKYSKRKLISTIIILIVLLILIIALSNTDIDVAILGVLTLIFIAYLIRLGKLIFYKIALKRSGMIIIDNKPQPKETFTQEQVNNYWNNQR